MQRTVREPFPDEVAVFFRDQLREARAKALANGEDFDDLIHVFERLGSYLSGGDRNGLRRYQSRLLERIQESLSLDSVDTAELNELFAHVCDSRNEAVHQGAFARHLTGNSVQFALVLEDALMAECEQRVKRYMVSNPICANLWQPISLVRQAMMSNAFSHLPLNAAGAWKLIYDDAVARYLRFARDRDERRQRLAATVDAARELGLELIEAVLVHSDDSIASILSRPSYGRPYLVVDRGNAQQPEGILAPFDLL